MDNARIYPPSEALQIALTNKALYCRPLRADGHIIMNYGDSLDTFMLSDNDVRLEKAEYGLGPDWFLPGVEWIVLSDLQFAFLNYEDQRLISAITITPNNA